MVKALKYNVKYLNKRDFNPKFNIIVNVASNLVQDWLGNNNIGIQLVVPNNHRVNDVERVIQTNKNHSIEGLCCCDDNFPTILWSKLIRQCQDSLNVLRTSRGNSRVSAFHVLEVPHDFNQMPFAPPVTRDKIFNPQETRSPWGPCVRNAGYIIPAYNYYQCWELYVPSTGVVRTSGQAKCYPTHYDMPTYNPMNESKHLEFNLTQSVLKL